MEGGNNTSSFRLLINKIEEETRIYKVKGKNRMPTFAFHTFRSLLGYDMIFLRLRQYGKYKYSYLSFQIPQLLFFLHFLRRFIQQ